MDQFFQTIQGWFNCEPLYREMVRDSSSGSVFVEVGAWKGQSAAFMSVEIANSQKDIEFHVVDNFLGSEKHQKEDAIVGGTLYQQFLDNLSPVAGLYSIHRSSSADAAKSFQDQSIDFCYIDALHKYEDVKEDILCWLPKMKPGALLAGDDYEYYPGVAKAVDELLPGFTRDGNIWRYVCPST
jgi:hypothetical protein